MNILTRPHYESFRQSKKSSHLQTQNYVFKFTKLYFVGKTSSISQHFIDCSCYFRESSALLFFRCECGGGLCVQATLAKRLSCAKLCLAEQNLAEHCSVAVVLQVKDVAGLVAALLHDPSLHHHLHLVLEGKLSQLVFTSPTSSSAHFWREET